MLKSVLAQGHWSIVSTNSTILGLRASFYLS